MTSPWKAALGIILIFILGFFSGVLCSSIFVHHRIHTFLQDPAAVTAAALEKRLTGNLSLDPDQRQKIDDLFLDNVTKRKALQKEMQPRMQALNREILQQINSVLNPDQRDRFHQNIDDVRRSSRKNFGKDAANPNEENPSSPNIQPSGPATNSGTGGR